MKIIITTSSFKFEKFPDNFEIVYNPYKRTMTESEINTFIQKEKPDGIIAGVEPLTRNVLKNSSNLKVISRCGSGLDSVDLEAAKELCIEVFNTHEEVIQSVSEMTISLALNLLRHINIMDSRMKKNEWKKMQGRLLSGKTVGIIGYGRIGKKTAMLFKAFGCKIICYDPLLLESAECEQVDLSTLLANSDIISLHLPVNSDTLGLVDELFLKQMKNSSVLINTARGDLVNEEHLYKALSNGIIKGAAIDVFSEEPYSGILIDPLIADKIILTPHVSSNTLEGREKMEEKAAGNLISFMNI